MVRIHTVALFHLPNAGYHPEAKNLTEDKLSQTAENILALAGLTLVGFCMVVTRAFSLPVRYQLAFVLETQLERV